MNILHDLTNDKSDDPIEKRFPCDPKNQWPFGDEFHDWQMIQNKQHFSDESGSKSDIDQSENKPRFFQEQSFSQVDDIECDEKENKDRGRMKNFFF
jgi:hypothetical protein